MFKRDFSLVSLWQFELLSRQQGIAHFVSGREGGVSLGEKGPLNLSFKVGDESLHVLENRARVAKALSIPPENLVIPDQTHSIHVKQVKTGKENLEDTDALISTTKGLCIAVMSADCVPVLLYDPKQKACGAIHAGWKGTVGKIIMRTIEAMRNEFGTEPSDLMACIGPSICPEVYEIGTEVIGEVEKAFGVSNNLIKPGQEGKGFLNLWEANKLQLLSAGVKIENIELAGICTYKNSDEFFSARKTKNNTGRFAAGILLL